MERVNAWTTYSPEQEAELMHKAEAYKAFLNAGKTERECVKEAIRLAEEKNKNLRLSDIAPRLSGEN